MSLLWVQAAWYNARPGTEEWGEFGHGHESGEERQERYIRHIQQAHGVDRNTAARALQRVSRSFRYEEETSPVDYGFASAPHYGEEHPLMEDAWANIWEHAPIQDVALNSPIHASQSVIRHRNVAHNLFHPGQRTSSEDEEERYVGHPDAKPVPWSEEDADWSDFDSYGPTDLPRMIRQTDGSFVNVDGHHRVATDKLLGKSHARCRVVDIRNLGEGGRGLRSQAAWWNAEPDADWNPADHRQLHYWPAEREPYLHRIQALHGVDRNTALRAALTAQANHPDPVLLGFASQPETAPAHIGPRPRIGADAWERAPVEDIDLHRTPIHASQDWMNTPGLFHNLFHPGKKPPSDTRRHFGNPDIDPDLHRSAADFAAWDRHSLGAPHDLPRLIRQTDGSLLAIDGHHRLAKDLMLGLATTRGRVLGVHALAARPSGVHPNRLMGPVIR